jgi:hypothetical protein
MISSDPLTNALADGVTNVPCGASINGAAPSTGVLGHMWRDLSLTQIGVVVPGVVALAGSQGPRVEATRARRLNELGCHVSFDSASRLGELETTISPVQRR